MSQDQIDSSHILKTAYRVLGFDEGEGYFDLEEGAKEPNLAQCGWIDQARTIGAHSLFFVKDYPTVVFFKLDRSPTVDTSAVEEDIRRLHMKVWNTSQIPIFFVALPGEIRVYSAHQKPARDVDEWRSNNKWLQQIKMITEVAKVAQLADFSREQIESGNVFAGREDQFNRESRVDQWLLKNLRMLSLKIAGADKKKAEHAHALIGRSIFIRYLEDRGVLVKSYFSDLSISRNVNYERYTDVLSNKVDTYNLFGKLRDDFNGDLFQLTTDEEETIDQPDLNILQGFLEGRHMAGQPDLLFWAYEFNIIPTELISSIYEEFYKTFNDENVKAGGTHYTPMPLVDMVLTEALTEDRLKRHAEVLDCACGSGIFLVEAFKRMVYHECRTRQVIPEKLPREVLVEILTDRIAGIDVNRGAVQVAAFSLYLAFLDFRKPSDIKQHKALPRLIYDAPGSKGGKTLFYCNAFEPTQNERMQIKQRLGDRKVYRGRRFDELLLTRPKLPLGDRRFDVIIGNPPWGAIGEGDDSLPLIWSASRGYPVGDKELSQCFLWRTNELLKPGGEIGLLVSAGILVKHSEPSRCFRSAWLTKTCIRAVYNFSQARKVFFRKKTGASAPFVVVFCHPADEPECLTNSIVHCSVRQDGLTEQLGAVIIDRSDLKKVSQAEMVRKDWLWKTLMWGNENDTELIEELKGCHSSLQALVTQCYGKGFTEAKKDRTRSTGDLGVDEELVDARNLGKKVDISVLLKPIRHRKLQRVRNPELYRGPRLLIKRGISQSGVDAGKIQARIESVPFAFTSSIYAFRLDDMATDDRKVLLGIVISSLARYYHFLTCSTWGFWHDEIHLEEHLGLPVNLGKDTVARHLVLEAMKKMETRDQPGELILHDPNQERIVQDALDNAVFDLYGLSENQKDLVRDFSNFTLDLYYRGSGSNGYRAANVEIFESYRDAFIDVWKDRLAIQGKELECRVYLPPGRLLAGISFDLKDSGTALPNAIVTQDEIWVDWLRQLEKLTSRQWVKGVLVDRSVKALTESSILILKRAEIRCWTRSKASADAQELMSEVFRLEWNRPQGK